MLPGDSREAVSYTHLDVYKRQGLGNGLGVTTALLGIEGVALEQFLQPGPLPTLRIMTSGSLPPLSLIHI